MRIWLTYPATSNPVANSLWFAAAVLAATAGVAAAMSLDHWVWRVLAGTASFVAIFGIRRIRAASRR